MRKIRFKTLKKKGIFVILECRLIDKSTGSAWLAFKKILRSIPTENSTEAQLFPDQTPCPYKIYQENVTFRFQYKSKRSNLNLEKVYQKLVYVMWVSG